MISKSAAGLKRRIGDWLRRPIDARLRQITKRQESLHDLLMSAQWARSIAAAKNPLNRFGAKYFSQADEDGITLEIIRRIGIDVGTFGELGVGNGLENNTLILLASGWRGFWIGVEDLTFDHRLNPGRFLFFKDRITLENIVGLMQQGLRGLGGTQLDVLSIDLDGNDYYFIMKLLAVGISPKLLILEYNAKFPPPIKWTKVRYDGNHVWDGTDYFGASLALFSKLLAEFSYTLVCCNAVTGANAFFVKDEYLSHFPEIPKDIRDVFVGCQYQVYKQWGHSPSPKTIERMLLGDAN